MSIKQIVVLGAATLALLAPAVSATFIEKSFECPSDNTTTINLSFTEDNDVIYFNNHCSDTMLIEYLTNSDSDDWRTGFSVNPGTSGSDTVDDGVVSVRSY
jgi:hypothetical protein